MSKETKVTIGIVVLVAAGLVGLLVLGNRSNGSNSTSTNDSKAPVIDGIQCESEMVQIHYHAHLAMFQDGKEVALPAGIGIDNSASCLYWLHTHQPDGIIHIESPKDQQFTLGNFFDVWKQPLSNTQAGPIKASNGQKLTVYVNGQPYTGDPKAIVLTAHQKLVIEAGSPTVPPPDYTFPQGD
ncbi:MAG TPA: hypothetical protein VLF69_01470 [Candidatus Saccharimonadales bacterium]|nr:hypothetical protein [Candidatus Saccharimonadales bacterium]